MHNGDAICGSVSIIVWAPCDVKYVWSSVRYFCAERQSYDATTASTTEGEKNRQQHKAATAMAIAIESVSMIALKYFIRMVDLHWFVHVYHFFLFHFFNVIFLHIHYLIGLETVRGERAWKKCGHVKFYCQPNNVYTNKLCYNSLSFFYSFNAVEG